MGHEHKSWGRDHVKDMDANRAAPHDQQSYPASNSLHALPPHLSTSRALHRHAQPKVPETDKSDDKSWGLGELFSGWGKSDDAPDAGPKLGGRKKQSDDRFDSSRFDRRGLENKKAVKPSGINPLDPSTW